MEDVVMTQSATKRLLITGASGFIGRAITAVIAKRGGWEIYALTSGRRAVFFPDGVKTVSADLRDVDACEAMMERLRPEAVIHLAWNLEGRDFLTVDENLHWLEISLRLLRAFNRYGTGERRFLFSGSSSEYGYRQEICREEGPAYPEDLYGTCKLQFTNVARTFSEIYGIRFVDARFFSVYGPGESHLLHIIPVEINAMFRGQPFVCKGPNNIWDYVYVDDVAEAVARILESNHCGCINVGYGPVSMREVTSIIADLTGGKEHLSFENEDEPGRTLVADTRFLREMIGFAPRIGIKEGLIKTVAWWRAQQ